VTNLYSLLNINIVATGDILVNDIVGKSTILIHCVCEITKYRSLLSRNQFTSTPN